MKTNSTERNRRINPARRFIALALMLCMMIMMAPGAEVYAAGSQKSGSAAGSAGSAEMKLGMVPRAGSKNSTAGKDSKGKAAKSQVVVLYEDGEVNTEAPKAAAEKKSARNAKKAKNFGLRMKNADGMKAGKAKTSTGGNTGKSDTSTGSAPSGLEAAENTLGQQAEILTDSLGTNYLIEDTLVFENQQKGSDESVVSLVSSDKYSTEQLVEKLEANDKVKIAEPNYVFHALAMPDWNDTYLKDAWQNGEKGINADKVWNLDASAGTGADSQTGASGNEVVLAVIDTGIDYSHPDLANRMWTAPAGFKLKGEHGVDFVYDDDDPMDENGHGTHCAGIIAAAADNSEGVAGVAGKNDNIRLMGVRVLDEEGAGYLEDIVAGFYYIIRAKNAGVNIRAVNCSLGASSVSDIFDTVMDKAGAAGILTICAAGNETADNDVVPSAPANCSSPYIVSVAALDDNGKLASYSNYGNQNVDIASPGSNVLSTVSYPNYAPYLYDNERIGKTTEYYGEFGSAEIVTSEDASGNTVQKVKPVLGTDYNGDAVTGVSEFGESVMIADVSDQSKGKATLELTDENGFGIGNNKTSLRWHITGASDGDTYVLYFPYEKMASGNFDTYVNTVFRTHTEEDGVVGELAFGDVVSYVDKNGKLAYKTVSSGEDSMVETMPVSYDWNSIWQASGALGMVFPINEIKAMGIQAAKASGADESIDADAGSDETANETMGDDAASDNSSDQTSEEEEMSGAESNAGADSEEEETAYIEGTANGAEAKAAAAGNATDSDANEIADAAVNATDSDANKTAGANETASTTETTNDAAASNDAATDTTGSADTTDASADTAATETQSGFGLGMVLTIESAGDPESEDYGEVYVDISSMAISKVGADEEQFGKYDVYSGTSMATPVVTGAVGVIASLNPDLNADDLRDRLYETTRSGYQGVCSTGGALDFAYYTNEPTARKPVIGDATVAFDKKEVTISTKNAGDAPALKARFILRDGKKVDIAPEDVTISDGSIVIKDNYGLIGSYVSLELTNTATGLTGERAFYLVKGMKPFNDYFTMDVEQEEIDFFEWKNSQGRSTAADEEGEEEEEDPTFKQGLDYIHGANRLLLYDDAGIYKLARNDSKKMEVTLIGKEYTEFIDSYAAKQAKTNEMWAPDDPEAYAKAKKDGTAEPYFTTTLIGEPAYLGGQVYQLVYVDFTDRASTLLLGLDLTTEKWSVYFDTLSGVGSAPSDIDWQSLLEPTLAGFGDDLYLITEYPVNDEGRASGNTVVYKCTPDVNGSKWEKSADLPVAVIGGKAIAQGGNLYYFMATDDDGAIDRNVYKFDGKEWSSAGELPKMVFKKGKEIVEFIFVMEDDGISCAYGIDKTGIIISGPSFDGAGDTLRFNTTTGEVEPLEYSLWGNIGDRAACGTVSGNHLITHYYTDDSTKIAAKSIPIKTGYVNVKVKVIGKGKGTVIGGGSRPIGEACTVKVTPAKGSYIYNIKTKGLTKNINKKFGKSTKASRKARSSAFAAKSNATVAVHFGKVSTKIIAKKVQTVKVGTRKLKARTNGTYSAVKWKSSNKKLAKVNKNGTITFTKAARGKTVKLTAISKEKSKIRMTIKVKVKK